MSKVTVIPYITEGAFSIDVNNIGFVSNSVLKNMQPSIKGVPLTEEHDGGIVGHVLDSYYKPENGWYYAVVEVKNENILKKYKGVSCAYSGIWNETPYIHNGVKYNKTLENGEYYELALVNNPRYEEAKIIQKNSNNNNKTIGKDVMEEKQKNDAKQEKENLLTHLRRLLFGSEKNDDETTKKEEDTKQKNENATDKKEKVDNINNDDKESDSKTSEVDMEKLIDEKIKNAFERNRAFKTKDDEDKKQANDEPTEKQKKGEQQHQDMQKNSMQNHIISADDAIIENFETQKYSPNPKQ